MFGSDSKHLISLLLPSPFPPNLRHLIIFICVSIYARAESCSTVSVRKGIIMKRESLLIVSVLHRIYSHFFKSYLSEQGCVVSSSDHLQSC